MTWHRFVSIIWALGMIVILGFWWKSASGDGWVGYSSRAKNIDVSIVISAGSAAFLVSSFDEQRSRDSWEGEFMEYDGMQTVDGPLVPPSMSEIVAGDFEFQWNTGSEQGDPNEWMRMILVPFWAVAAIYTVLCAGVLALAIKRIRTRRIQIAQQAEAPNPGDG